MQYNNILRIFIIVLVLGVTIAWATETTWRHSGFEVSGYDINFSQVYNITNLRVLNFGWNSSIPPPSVASKATMYYDDNAKQIKYSVNGGAYQQINDVSTAISVLPNASIPISAMNYSSSRIYVNSFTRNTSLNGTQSITGIGFKPVAAKFNAVVPSTSAASWGFDDGVNARATLDFHASIANTYEISQFSIYFRETTANFFYGKVTSWDADGFTITWTTDGSPSGTATINYMVFR